MAVTAFTNKLLSLKKISGLLEPNHPDPILARQQRLLNLVLAGLAVPGALFGVVMLILCLLGKTPITGAIAGLGVQPFYALSYWLSRKGKVTLAAYIPVGAVFLAMVGGSFQLGVGHVTYIGFAMTTLTASILIGNGAGIFMAVLCTLVNLATGALQAGQRLPAALDPLTTSLADSIGMGLGLGVLIVFTGIYGSELKKALLTQQALSAELQVRGTNLDLQVRRRTRDLERRVVQIRTAAEISRAISALLEPTELLQKVVDLIRERFKLYYAGVFLLDPQGDYAVLRAGTGEAGQKMLREAHRLAVGGNSMIGWTTFHRQPRIALEIDEQAGPQRVARFNNPHLPLTRSELALPILTGGSSAERCLGAITIQSDQENAFDQDDITVLQAIADSLATALENARLYQQSQANLEEIRNLHRQYLSRMWSEVRHLPEDMRYTYEAPQAARSEANGGRIIEVPLILRGQTIGSLTLEAATPGNNPEQQPGQPLSFEEMALLEAVATETAIALENARLMEETQRQAQRERSLADILARVRASSDIQAVLQTSILELGRALRASEGYIELDVND